MKDFYLVMLTEVKSSLARYTTYKLTVFQNVSEQIANSIRLSTEFLVKTAFC
jgi:hypothetical protein